MHFVYKVEFSFFIFILLLFLFIFCNGESVYLRLKNRGTREKRVENCGGQNEENDKQGSSRPVRNKLGTAWTHIHPSDVHRNYLFTVLPWQYFSDHAYEVRKNGNPLVAVPVYCYVKRRWSSFRELTRVGWCLGFVIILQYDVFRFYDTYCV